MMGFSADEWGRMSPWQTTAMTIGWLKVHGEEGMSEAEMDEIWEWMQNRPDERTVYH